MIIRIKADALHSAFFCTSPKDKRFFVKGVNIKDGALYATNGYMILRVEDHVEYEMPNHGESENDFTVLLNNNKPLPFRKKTAFVDVNTATGIITGYGGVFRSLECGGTHKELFKVQADVISVSLNALENSFLRPAAAPTTSINLGVDTLKCIANVFEIPSPKMSGIGLKLTLSGEGSPVEVAASARPNYLMLAYPLRA